jgi:hypothetical protein
MLIKMVIDSSHEIKLGLNPESARIFNRCLTKEYINEYNIRTYSQIHIQVIFAVKNRNNLIQPSWEEELYKYINGIV